MISIIIIYDRLITWQKSFSEQLKEPKTSIHFFKDQFLADC